MGKTGSTVVLLHHSSQTSWQAAAVAESNAGNAAFNSVPDQILSLKWLADADADGQQAVIAGWCSRPPAAPVAVDARPAAGAISRLGPAFTHGETGDALDRQNA